MLLPYSWTSCADAETTPINSNNSCNLYDYRSKSSIGHINGQGASAMFPDIPSVNRMYGGVGGRRE